MTEMDPFAIDLDAERTSRAAERETGDGAPIRFGGQTIATLPPELPLAVLAPLRDLDQDITLMLRSAMQVAQAGDDARARMASTELVIDLIAANPALPVALLDTIKSMSVALIGQDGFDALMDARLSVPDVVALTKGVVRYYGMSLGESSEPSDSSEGNGETSSTTSSPTSESTPVDSGSAQETPASLESVGS